MEDREIQLATIASFVQSKPASTQDTEVFIEITVEGVTLTVKWSDNIVKRFIYVDSIDVLSQEVEQTLMFVENRIIVDNELDEELEANPPSK